MPMLVELLPVYWENELLGIQEIFAKKLVRLMKTQSTTII